MGWVRLLLWFTTIFAVTWIIQASYNLKKQTAVALVQASPRIEVKAPRSQAPVMRSAPELSEPAFRGRDVGVDASAQAANVSGFHLDRVIVSPVLINFHPEQVVVGDVTGNQIDDVIVALSGHNQTLVRIHVQDTTGALAAPEEFLVPNQSGYVGSLELVDLDRDGLREIVVGAGNGLVVIRKTLGGFEQRFHAGTLDARYLAAIDVDGDGYQDVVAQSWSDGADIYLSDRRGGFRSIQRMSTPVIGYNLVEVADFSADGFPDLILSNFQGFPSVWIYPSVPSAGLQPPIHFDFSSVLSRPPSGITVADLDRDGRPDLVLADTGWASLQPKGIHIFYRGEGNQFREHKFLLLQGTYDRPGALQIADIDGNGYPDIVFMINSDDRMGYFLQNETGFAQPVFQSTDDNPWTNNFYFDNSFVIADVNSDGCPDVVLAETSSSLRIFYGRNCTVAPRVFGGPLPPRRR